MMDQHTFIQICVRMSEEGATGRAVAEQVEIVASSIQAPWVVISDIDASGEVRCDLLVTSREVKILKTEQLIELLKRAEQIIWASIFFCSDLATASAISPYESYEDSTLKAAAVVRVVDATYLYVTGPKPTAEHWSNWFIVSEMKEGTIDQMDFPE